MNSVELLFKYRKTIERMTNSRFEFFAANGVWYKVENLDAV